MTAQGASRWHLCCVSPNSANEALPGVITPFHAGGAFGGIGHLAKGRPRIRIRSRDEGAQAVYKSKTEAHGALLLW